MELTRGTDVKTRGRHPYEPGLKKAWEIVEHSTKCWHKREKLGADYIFLEQRVGLILAGKRED